MAMQLFAKEVKRIEYAEKIRELEETKKQFVLKDESCSTGSQSKKVHGDNDMNYWELAQLRKKIKLECDPKG